MYYVKCFHSFFFFYKTEVAKVILDKCTLSPPNCPDPDEPYYSILFNYEFVVKTFKMNMMKGSSSKTARCLVE